MIHITALESMATELNDLGVNVTEHDLITTIMCSLPTRFGYLSSSWDNLPDTERSMDALRARIVSEQRRIYFRKTEELNTQNGPRVHNGDDGQQHTSTNTTDGTALPAFGSQRVQPRTSFRGNNRGRRGAPNGGPRDAGNRDNAWCTYCGKPRHYEFECRLRIANGGEKQSTPFKRPNDGRTGGYTQKKVDFSFVSVCYLTTTDPDALYLDSGATRHMSGDQSYFHDMKNIQDKSWLINGIGGMVLYARGIGTIKLTGHLNGTTINERTKECPVRPRTGCQPDLHRLPLKQRIRSIFQWTEFNRQTQQNCHNEGITKW